MPSLKGLKRMKRRVQAARGHMKVRPQTLVSDNQGIRSYVRSQKFGYFGHWLSDKNTLEVKNFNT